MAAKKFRATRFLTGAFGQFTPGQVISGVSEATAAAWTAAGAAEGIGQVEIESPPEIIEPEMAVTAAPEAAVIRRTSARAPQRPQKRKG